MEPLVKSELRGCVRLLTLNDPASFNAMDPNLSAALLSAVEEAEADPATRAVVITGAGKAFCAGGNLKAVLASEGGISPTLCGMVEVLNRMTLILRRSGKIFIAAVNGVAAGAGMSLAMACDLRIVSERAKFRQAYSSSGLTPDAGWTVFAAELLGPHKAMELVLRDPLLSAAEALELGLANEVCPAEQLEERTMAIAEEIAAKPAFALGLAKAQINRTQLDTLEQRLQQELDMMAQASSHADAAEGIRAFAEKRTPVFNR